MTRGVPFVDAKGLRIKCLKLGKCLADRGQLVRSAAGHVLWIENQERALFSPKIRKRDFFAGGAAKRKIGRRLSKLDHRCSFA
jgi:hypothetical protein